MFARGSPRTNMMQAASTQKKLSPKSIVHMRKKGLTKGARHTKEEN
jgi:hypothetical protein